jgi:glycosyltransferase involved in cell wall biosynthesis
MGGAPKHIDLLFNNISSEFLIYFAAPISEPYGVSWFKSAGKERFFELEHRKFSISKLFKLKSFIKNNEIKIVHAHGKGAGLYGRLLKLLLSDRIKLIFTFHGLHIDEYSAIKKKIYLIYERILSLYTDVFINVSNGERDNCLKYNLFPFSKSVVVYNAVPKVSYEKNKTEIRNMLHLPVDKFIILSLVRFSFAKNIEATLEIAQILNSDNRFIFVIVGDGETKQNVEDQIIKNNITNIILTGFKNNPLDYILASDVYLSTSRWEGLPFALIESSMIGLPAVATDVVGNNEVIKHDFNGKLFNTDNFQLAANFIKEICLDKNLSDNYALNSKKYFEQNFTINKMILQIIDIYNK